MRIGIVTQYFPPETGAPQNRLFDLAKRLAGKGHAVQVLTALPNYPGDSIFPEYEKRGEHSEIMSGVLVHRLRPYVPRRKTMVGRLACYLSFALRARQKGPRLLRGVDVVLMETPPLFLALAAVRIARSLCIPLVVNVSDLWPRSAVDLGIVKPGLLVSLAEVLERWMYRSADLITGQTEGIVRDIKFRHPDKNIELFPNGVDLEEFTPGDCTEVREQFGWQPDEFVVGYAGVLGHAQALNQVLSAAGLLAGRPKVRIAIFGDGPCREELKARLTAENLLRVSIYGPVQRDFMPGLQRAFDAGLVPLARGSVFQGARPSKMFEIMASARPVILCARGEAPDLLNMGIAGPAGITVPPEDPPALAGAIRFLCENREYGRQMGHNGRNLVTTSFDRSVIAGQIGELLEGVIARRTSEGII
jgi:glycosyltransferase involved in cell wall biosynthesis